VVDQRVLLEGCPMAVAQRLPRGLHRSCGTLLRL
jgi:hypothetical protein